MDIGYALKPLLENEKNNILGIEAEINEIKLKLLELEKKLEESQVKKQNLENIVNLIDKVYYITLIKEKTGMDYKQIYQMSSGYTYDTLISTVKNYKAEKVFHLMYTILVHSILSKQKNGVELIMNAFLLMKIIISNKKIATSFKNAYGSYSVQKIVPSIGRPLLIHNELLGIQSNLLATKNLNRNITDYELRKNGETMLFKSLQKE